MARAEAMRRHVLDVCQDHDIQITWARGSKAWALSGGEEIVIPPIRSAITYAVALHEIGHVMGRHQLSRSRIVRERWAWAWARRHAIVWTPAMARTMHRCLDWYERRSWPPIPTFAELNPHLAKWQPLRNVARRARSSY